MILKLPSEDIVSIRSVDEVLLRKSIQLFLHLLTRKFEQSHHCAWRVFLKKEAYGTEERYILVTTLGSLGFNSLLGR